MANQFTKAKALGLPNPIPSEATLKKWSVSATITNNRRFSDPKNRDRQSAAMKLAVEKYPESYGPSNRGRTKRIDKHGQAFQGKWELYFFEWCLENNVEIKRVTESFPYEWNGSRKYFPDFYLPQLSMYAEVKGYETPRDLAKWRDFPHRLKIIRRADIEKILKRNFDLGSLAQLVRAGNS